MVIHSDEQQTALLEASLAEWQPNPVPLILVFTDG
jgi:hypothetical protein